MDPVNVAAELELVDCYDDEDDLGPLGTVGATLDAAAELEARVDVHDWAARRGALDRHAAQFGLEAVNRLMFRGLEQVARMPGRTVAAIPDELARFWQADDAYWLGYQLGNWYNATDVCGATRYDELGELEEVCLVAPHDAAAGHGWARRNVAVTW